MRDLLNYWKRIFKVYLTREKGYLGFWHEIPAISNGITPDKLGPYYMTFSDKANYRGPRDGDGVILFDYYGDIGRQYNPLAVAQYGLGHYNLYLKTRDKKNLREAEIQAKWLVKNLEMNEHGLLVWKHHFRWRYKQYLEAGWYSAHSQGTGISLLARMYKETRDDRYLRAAHDAFISMTVLMNKGGVQYIDSNNNIWLEEYLIEPPTCILNGFLWALWGVWDFYLFTKDSEAKTVFEKCITTLKKNLSRFDWGIWSLYDLSHQALKMVASPFYHKLHIVQLHATGIITHDQFFESYAKKFESYERNPIYRLISFIYKVVFKLVYF
ncbi:MAG: D-glucuronyl C5-epimerase family protein [Patescibacteria group bacterium]